MVTVSHLVERKIEERPLLEEAISNGIVSYAALARRLKPEIEEELGREVKHSAIMMALRRFAERVQERARLVSPILYSTEISMRTGICDIAVVRSPSLIDKIGSLYDMVEFERGDVLNIILGSYELSIITNARYAERVQEILAEEVIINVEDGLVSISLSYPKEFFYMPGIIFAVTRKLAWESINLMEVVSTMTELTFILGEKDGVRGYNALREFVTRGPITTG